MDLTEKTLSSEKIYDGAIIHVRRDRVLLPNGHTSTREIVEHPGGVGILALEADGTVLLVRQYRYAFGRTLLEIPAGKREPGEEPFVTARRELREETGSIAESWTPLGSLIASPGCYDGCCTSIWRRICTTEPPTRTRMNFWRWSGCRWISWPACVWRAR